MQIEKKDYTEGINAEFATIGIRHELAPMIFIPSLADDNDDMYGELSAIPMKQYSEYRGKVLICSTDKGMGFTEGTAELYDVRGIDTISEDEWNTNVLLPNRELLEGYLYLWFIRNPRKAVEVACNVRKGFQYTYWYSEDDVQYYPVHLSAEEIELIKQNKVIKNGLLWAFQQYIIKQSLRIFLKVWLMVYRIRKWLRKSE